VEHDGESGPRLQVHVELVRKCRMAVRVEQPE
jgi:hypothetical protein